jgi:hypothetical protein
MKTEHTPTPWVLGGASGRMITTPDGYSGDGFLADVDTLANAEFIVRAVNSHDNLVRLLALVRPYVHQVMDMESKEFVGPIIDGILEAESIAQAEGAKSE